MVLSSSRSGLAVVADPAANTPAKKVDAWVSTLSHFSGRSIISYSFRPITAPKMTRAIRPNVVTFFQNSGLSDAMRLMIVIKKLAFMIVVFCCLWVIKIDQSLPFGHGANYMNREPHGGV